MRKSSLKDFEKLRKDLEEYQEWPSDYIFKFIIYFFNVLYSNVSRKLVSNVPDLNLSSIIICN